MADTKQHVQGAEEKMNFAIEYLDEQLSHIRAGKANPRLLDSIKVPYYGAPTPLNNYSGCTYDYDYSVGKENHSRYRKSHS